MGARRALILELLVLAIVGVFCEELNDDFIVAFSGPISERKTNDYGHDSIKSQDYFTRYPEESQYSFPLDYLPYGRNYDSPVEYSPQYDYSFVVNNPYERQSRLSPLLEIIKKSLASILDKQADPSPYLPPATCSIENSFEPKTFEPKITQAIPKISMPISPSVASPQLTNVPQESTDSNANLKPSTFSNTKENASLSTKPNPPTMSPNVTFTNTTQSTNVTVKPKPSESTHSNTSQPMILNPSTSPINATFTNTTQLTNVTASPKQSQSTHSNTSQPMILNPSTSPINATFTNTTQSTNVTVKPKPSESTHSNTSQSMILNPSTSLINATFTNTTQSTNVTASPKQSQSTHSNTSQPMILNPSTSPINATFTNTTQSTNVTAKPKPFESTHSNTSQSTTSNPSTSPNTNPKSSESALAYSDALNSVNEVEPLPINTRRRPIINTE